MFMEKEICFGSSKPEAKGASHLFLKFGIKTTIIVGKGGLELHKIGPKCACTLTKHRYYRIRV